MANEHNEVKQAILDFEILLKTRLETDLIQPDARVKTNLNNILFAEFFTERKCKNFSVS